VSARPQKRLKSPQISSKISGTQGGALRLPAAQKGGGLRVYICC
jgi:hypothetical protein